jgi:hypothetical protein
MVAISRNIFDWRKGTHRSEIKTIKCVHIRARTIEPKAEILKLDFVLSTCFFRAENVGVSQSRAFDHRSVAASTSSHRQNTNNVTTSLPCGTQQFSCAFSLGHGWKRVRWYDNTVFVNNTTFRDWYLSNACVLTHRVIRNRRLNAVRSYTALLETRCSACEKIKNKTKLYRGRTDGRVVAFAPEWRVVRLACIRPALNALHKYARYIDWIARDAAGTINENDSKRVDMVKFRANLAYLCIHVRVHMCSYSPIHLYNVYIH